MVIERQLAEVLRQLGILNRKVDTLMSEDAAIQAVTADESAQLAKLSALIAQVLAEVAGGGVQPATVQALQAQQAALDTAVAGFDASLNPPAPPAPTA